MIQFHCYLPRRVAEVMVTAQEVQVCNLITFGLVFLIFYFLIIRPQSKRQKDTKSMLANLQKGDKVITIGGIRGVIQSLKDDTVMLKIAGDVVVEFSRSAISNVVGANSTPPSAKRSGKPTSTN